MRYNEKELQALSRQPAEMAAELGMRGPKKGSVLKRRLVKLVVNFLFYFRTDEAEPVGALLLERCRVIREEPGAFSISFIEDPERKYHFECSSEEQCQEWMEALRRASYEFMRRSLVFYRNEIRKVTGKKHRRTHTGLPRIAGHAASHGQPRNTKVNALVKRACAVLTAPSHSTASYTTAQTRSRARARPKPRRVNSLRVHSAGVKVKSSGQAPGAQEGAQAAAGASEECGGDGPAFGTGAVRRGSWPGGVSENGVRRCQRLVSTKRVEAGAGLGTR
ncbi:pleckstrin homology domain-containing family J member 1 isoform X1 [Macaca thibetana thibetana]|uniref:pleckstrin homology domain-containing family J member 1 isoform X1 n=1 Tax=Macaca thibetana thibetana TaxID=257877 RepID=UPI0021BCB063|nr:pleckstrin homology domain-containing family J member 1 isoform X1 [Macaca thibetana thibetana]